MSNLELELSVLKRRVERLEIFLGVVENCYRLDIAKIKQLRNDNGIGLEEARRIVLLETLNKMVEGKI